MTVKQSIQKVRFRKDETDYNTSDGDVIDNSESESEDEEYIPEDKKQKIEINIKIEK